MTGCILDRDQAREVLAPWLEDATDLGWQQVLDRLAGCVRPATIDRDELITELTSSFRGFDAAQIGTTADRIIDAVAAAVRPAAIDREELLQAVRSMRHSRGIYDTEMVDRILTLVRPVAGGVTLTPEDVPLVTEGLRLLDFAREGEPRAEALAARLEAAQ